MIYEVELIRIFDGAFEVSDIEADNPKDAYELALEDTSLFHPVYYWTIDFEDDAGINIRDLCFFRQVEIRDEDGKEVHNQLYSEPL